MVSLRVRYQTIDFGDVDIHVRTLRDNLQYLDIDGVAEKLGISSAAWPIFGVIWASSEVLAHHMLNYNITGKRILEVGCGIALTSLLLNHRLADITATDYHPEVESFLLKNTLLNHGNAIPFVRTGWGDKDSGLGKFDLVIGSDLLYERAHTSLLSHFIEQHAKPTCDVILVDPGRGHHANFSKKMVALGYSHTQCKPASSTYLDHPFKGQILSYHR
ncbi:putative 3-demethylubiquinone-9 3-methyltransferase [Desulforapulum autotrophicum HRM2]|uniref:3-demethylubiquinone-9 3-methyltransferase n=1 Tax=Desulforapulum autotrophicum (strain ATCC 43914 / DSM 3382 / VKM B-1955 / HRM2) TaxID=177437 RepID=C0QGK4_DESAH|nr:histidine kinase [Desulforapulum autotrophicum]ACN13479.1 putative 3-demethylubiquinone-9 3-methyltransferase [Desulforapulum autotrophicum HRM2]